MGAPEPEEIYERTREEGRRRLERPYHVVVVSLELIFGIRFGAHIPWVFMLQNFGVAAAGNMIGGIGLVTLNRFTQARSGGGANSSSG